MPYSLVFNLILKHMMRLPEIPPEAFAPLLEELRRKPLEVNRYRKHAGDGRSQSWGVINRRCAEPDYSRMCWRRPALYKLLLEFGEKYVPFPFTSITVNQNYAAKPHYDRGNLGESYLVAFGSYSGGELEILEGESKGKFDICRKPVVEDFSLVLHQVLPFEGERYSLVFYTFWNPRWVVDLPPPSVIEVDGVFKFKRGEEVIESGLDHPLLGYKHSSFDVGFE